MTCAPCEGTGLKSQYEVCPECRGLGHDGTVVPTEVKKEEKAAPKKK